MPSRRSFLGLAAVVTAASSGCLSVPAGSAPEASSPPTKPSTTNRTSSSPTTSSSPANQTSSSPSTTRPEPKGPVPGEADSITVEKTVSDPDYEYVASNDTVRYPAVMSGDDVVRYGYEPFDDWAYTEGAFVAATAVGTRIRERVASSGGLSVGVSAGEGDTLVPLVTVQTHLDREGNIISEPEVAFSAVVDATPRSVTTSVSFAGKSRTNEYAPQVVTRTVQNA